MRDTSFLASLVVGALVGCGGSGSGPGPHEERDTTPPTVSARVPEPLATGVWSRAPIAIKFSEAMAAPAPGAVELTSSVGGHVAATVTRSDDGRTLTIVPASLPPVPGTLQVTFPGQITDLAGNPLSTPPGWTWSWTLPQWQRAASFSIPGDVGENYVATAVGPDDTVWVGWQRGLGSWPRAAPQIRKANGGEGEDMGTVPNSGTGRDFYPVGFDMAVDAQGRLVVADLEYAGASAVFVFRLDGTTWTRLGPAVTEGAVEAPVPRLLLDASGDPVVAWTEPVEGVRRVLVARWDGDAWRRLGEPIGDPSSHVSAFDMAFGPGGALSLASLTGSSFDDDGSLRLDRFDGSSWTEAGSPGSLPADEVSLAFDETGAEVVACADRGGTVQAYRWAGGGLEAYGPPASSGGHQVALRHRPSGAPGERLVLSFVVADGPRVLGWTGTGWSSIAQEIATPTGAMYGGTGDRALSVGSSGVLSYAWAEWQSGTGLDLHVVRYNR